MHSDSELHSFLTIAKAVTNYNQWIYRLLRCHFNPQNTILDIGSGLGNVAEYFSADNSLQIIVSDASDTMLEELKERFSNRKNYRFLKLDIGDSHCLSTQPPATIDTITCINVLEHIENDAIALMNMRHLLRHHGSLLLLVPAMPIIYGTLDQLSGHYRRYTKKELNKKIGSAHFHIKTQYYMNLFGVATWFLANKIAKQKKVFGSACAFLDKIIPAIEQIEKLCRPAFGQSIVTVCTKE